MFLALTAALQEDRRQLLALAQHVQGIRHGRHKQDAINELYLALNAHLDFIEEEALPLLRNCHGHSLPDSFSAHHEELRALMSTVVAHRTDGPGLSAALARLGLRLVLHGERERLFLVPAIDRAMAARQHRPHDPGLMAAQRWSDGRMAAAS